MARSIAPSDPVFFLHHAFIDYQWEQFRKQQIDICKIDPTTDYPPVDDDDDDHHPDKSMDGMRFLDNIDGIAAYWTENWFNYAPTPTCANNCGNSSDIFCDEELYLCVSEMAFDVEEGNSRKKRQAPSPGVSANARAYKIGPVKDKCKKNPYAGDCLPKRKPETNIQIIDALVQKDITMPSKVEKVHKYIRSRIERAEQFPPENEEVVFRASPEEENDQRTRESCVYDLLNAMVEGKKISRKTKSGDELRASLLE